MIKNFHKLNTNGQKLIIDQVETLVASGKYSIKTGKSEVVGGVLTQTGKKDKKQKLRTKIYDLLINDDEKTVAGNVFDAAIITLILVNVLAVIISTFNIPSQLQEVFLQIEIVSIIVFTLEYFLRLWTSVEIYNQCSSIRSRIKYIFSFMAVIDLLSILPFYLPFLIKIDLRVLRLFRLIRLFKISRYVSAFSQIGFVIKKKKNQLISSFFITGILIIIASVLMYTVENAAQPNKFENIFSGFWWSVATLTTVGYGDIYPITNFGKVLSAIIALLGVGFVAIPTGIISGGFIEMISDEKEKKFCPNCGDKID